MDHTLFIEQLDTFLALYKEMRAKSEHNDISDIPKSDRQSPITRSVVAIHRITGVQSIYSSEVKRLIERDPALHVHTSSIMGVVQALRDDLKAGYVQNLSEVAHAEVFSDFLDMARYLSDSGYKDAAAVIAGSTLESHLRSLSAKNSISITDTSGRHVKADKLNADLAKATVYGLLDQKNITGHLDLRNSAAHGDYSKYTKEQVDLMISGITDFIARVPA